MQIGELIIGGNIELEARKNGNTMTFRSIIETIKDTAIFIKPIKVNGQTVGFSENCILNFYYKIDGKLFVWENAAIKLVKLNTAIYHKVDLLGEGKQCNRREAYRMYLGEEMPIYVNSINGPNAVSVLIKDISETGMGFISSDEFEIGRTVRIKLKDMNSVLNLSALIVRKEFTENIQSYLYGCRFTEKCPLLGRYIARKQEEFLRKKNSAYSANPSRQRRSN